MVAIWPDVQKPRLRGSRAANLEGWTHLRGDAPRPGRGSHRGGDRLPVDRGRCHGARSSRHAAHVDARSGSAAPCCASSWENRTDYAADRAGTCTCSRRTNWRLPPGSSARRGQPRLGSRWRARCSRPGTVSIAFFGDGATSAGHVDGVDEPGRGLETAGGVCLQG